MRARVSARQAGWLWCCAVLVVVSLLASPTAHALQASPASHTIAYTGQDSVTYTLKLMNDESATLQLTLTYDGELAGLIVAPSSLMVEPGETKEIAITVGPLSGIQPGVSEGQLIIESARVSGGTVAASSAVAHIVRVQVPREGSFLDGRILFSQGAPGAPQTITVVLTNTGTDSLLPLPVTLDIVGDDAPRQSLTSRSAPLAATESTNVPFTWTPNEEGSYGIEVLVPYAGKQLVLDSTLVIGDLHATVENISFGAFSLGEPFRASLLVRNDWGELLPLTARAALVQDGVVISQAESTVVRIAPGMTAAVPVFLQSAGAHRGAAELVTTLEYGDQTNFRAPVAISDDMIAVGDYRQDGRGLGRALTVVLSLIGLLILVAILITWYLSKRRRGKQGGRTGERAW